MVDGADTKILLLWFWVRLEKNSIQAKGGGRIKLWESSAYHKNGRGSIQSLGQPHDSKICCLLK